MLSVAPMMDRTDRHFRFLMRQITRRTLLYTEMITTHAILKGPRARLLAYDALEHPISLQLGGDDPQALAECARIAESEGYDEVNINVGCPSDRVQSGRFGVCLMAHPERVAEAVDRMRAKVRIPVTVKHRIGFDDLDAYEDMLRFVDIVAQSGCARFSVHARKAWLSGLSPKENRNVPPLRYEDVYRLKTERPALDVEINGGIRDLDQAAEHLQSVDAVMIGRAAYDTPLIFADADQRFYGQAERAVSPGHVVRAMVPYIESHLASGGRLHSVSRHMLTLFSGLKGARLWRRRLSEAAPRKDADTSVLLAALAEVERSGARSSAA